MSIFDTIMYRRYPLLMLLYGPVKNRYIFHVCKCYLENLIRELEEAFLRYGLHQMLCATISMG